MNPSSTSTLPALPTARLLLLALALYACLVAVAPRASAHVGGNTRFAGIVQSVDLRNKTLTFQPDAKGSSLSLGWNWQTEFLADDKRVKPDALKPGTRVKVKYVSPFFGREYATKLEWSTVAAAHP